jgi:hypothetical protein
MAKHKINTVSEKLTMLRGYLEKLERCDSDILDSIPLKFINGRFLYIRTIIYRIREILESNLKPSNYPKTIIVSNMKLDPIYVMMDFDLQLDFYIKQIEYYLEAYANIKLCSGADV